MAMPQSRRNPYPSHNWLLPLVSAATPVAPDAERWFHAAAEAALAGDLLARDALFAAFKPRFERSIRRIQRRWREQTREATIEADDIAQEAYLVFVDLLDEWRPGESISAHLSGQFHWRLDNALRVWRKPAPIRFAKPPAEPVIDVEMMDLIDAIAPKLERETKLLLLWRVRERLTFAQMASRAGISVRTIQRRWDGLINELAREGLVGAANG